MYSFFTLCFAVYVSDCIQPFHSVGMLGLEVMEKHWKGILGFWRFGGATNAAMEGFNNKVRTMLRQAYGYRDDEYMILKIYDLQNRKSQVVI